MFTLATSTMLMCFCVEKVHVYYIHVRVYTTKHGNEHNDN